MKISKCIKYLSSAVLLFNTAIYAASHDDDDIESLREWINEQRRVSITSLADRGGKLSISGDVHAEFQTTSQIKNGILERGPWTGSPHNEFDVELNLMIDYRTARSWVASKLKFDHDGGIFHPIFGSGGFHHGLRVESAYFGYRLMDQDCQTIDAEFGRRGPMLTFYDSRIMFSSNFDGIKLKHSYKFDGTDLYYQLGGFVVDEKRSHFGWLGEIGLLGIGNTGFYSKYSLIDWDTRSYDLIPSQFHFVISQLILGYKYKPCSIGKPLTIYSAGIYNHQAEPLALTHNKTANKGGYIGFSVGELKNAGDWSLDANYQILQAQACPDFDVQGVGLGSKLNGNGFYYVKEDKERTVAPSTSLTAEGNVNYRGFEITLQYLITKNLNIFQKWKYASTLDRSIGPDRKFNQYEIDLIYLF